MNEPYRKPFWWRGALLKNIARPSWPGEFERDFRLSVAVNAIEPKRFGYVFNRAMA
jgi:hypothetical protein